MRPIVTLAIVLALSACGSSSPSPKDVLQSIVAAALAQKSVHSESEGYGELGDEWTDTADVTADSAQFRERSNVLGTLGTLRLRLVQDMVYVRAGSRQLKKAAGLST